VGNFHGIKCAKEGEGESSSGAGSEREKWQKLTHSKKETGIGNLPVVITLNWENIAASNRTYQLIGRNGE